MPFAQERPQRHLPVHAEHQRRCLGRQRQLRRRLIVRIHHRHVLRRLVLENARLRRHIPLETPMPVQMVRRDVQDRSDMRAKALDRLQLETRYLQHAPTLFARTLHQFGHRSSDVAPHLDRLPRPGQHLSAQRRRGRLPVGSRDRDDLPFQKPRRQLHLAHDRDPQPPRLLQPRRITRHPRAHHDQVLHAERPLPVAAGLDRHSRIQQSSAARPATALPDASPIPSPARPAARRTAPTPRPICPVPPPVRACPRSPACVSAYLSFNVVSANSANTSAAIQKRTITFDSLHPSSSK